MVGPVIEQIEDQTFDGEDYRTEYEKTVEDVLSAFNAGPEEDNWHVTVHLVTGTNRRGGTEPYLFTCAVEELPIQERLLRDYGTGKYRARVFRNGRGFKTFTVDILAPPNSVKPADSQPWMAAIEASHNRLLQIIEPLAMRVSPPAPAQDPVDMMAKMLGMMTSLRTLIPEPAAGGGMEMFTKGMELAASMAEKMGGSNSGETGILDIIKEVVRSPQVGEVIAGLANRGAVQGAPAPGFQQQPMQPARLAAPPIPVAPPNPGGMTQEQSLHLVNQQIAYLISRAQHGSDPQLYAEFVLDNVPQGMIPQLLGNPNILAELQMVNPAMAHHLPWFNRLLEAIKEMAQSETEEGNEFDASGGPANHHDNHPGRPGGNAGNPAAHGKPGKAI